MSNRKEPKKPAKEPEWKLRGWKSEAAYLEARARITAQHRAQAKAAGIPWK